MRSASIAWHVLKPGTYPMDQCPEYHRCNANICPLDEGIIKRKHVEGDSVCFFAMETVKPGADARFTNPVWILIRSAADAMIVSLRKLKAGRGDQGMPGGLGDLLRRIEASAYSGSSIEARAKISKRMREKHAGGKASGGESPNPTGGIG